MATRTIATISRVRMLCGGSSYQLVFSMHSNAKDPPFYDADPWSSLDEDGNAEGLPPLEILRPDQMLLEFPNKINVSGTAVQQLALLSSLTYLALKIRLSPLLLMTIFPVFRYLLQTAPMVRYSKLPARMLFASYNTHITYTPMMVAREFVRSPKARDLEFTTNRHERGIFSFPSETSKNERRVRGALVAQFAARAGKEFADAVEMMAPHVDGIDLNCGW